MQISHDFQLERTAQFTTEKVSLKTLEISTKQVSIQAEV